MHMCLELSLDGSSECHCKQIYLTSKGVKHFSNKVFKQGFQEFQIFDLRQHSKLADFIASKNDQFNEICCAVYSCSKHRNDSLLERGKNKV